MTGLYRKYHIKKANGDDLSSNAECFVLRVDKDPHARVALSAYADSCEEDNPELASDLRYWVDHGLQGFRETHLRNIGFLPPDEPAHVAPAEHNDEGNKMSFSFDIPNPGRASKNTTSHISVQVDELCREREICGHLIRQLLGIIALSQNHGATLGDLHDELGEYFARWADDAGVELIPLSGKPNDKPQPRV